MISSIAKRSTLLFRQRATLSLQGRATVLASFSLRNYSEISPANKKDYQAFVDQWHSHFKNVDDDFELERGLNHIFAADWVPSVEVVEEAIKASRRLNTFSTAVRILEALEEKVYKKEQYQVYLRELQPLLDEYGIVDKTGLGEFLPYRERNPREE